MKIPARIKLGGHDIQVQCVTTAEISNRGTYNSYHNLIRLECETDTPESNIAETFLHEIIEAIKDKNNLELPHTSLSVLSETLFQVLRDNKLFFGSKEQ